MTDLLRESPTRRARAVPYQGSRAARLGVALMSDCLKPSFRTIRS
jgi:hypothetical protein